MNKRYLVISAAAIVIMLGLFGSVTSAAALSQVGAQEAPAGEDKAESPDHRPVRIFGMVAEVHENGILFMTQRDPVRVRVTDDTVIRVPDNGECVDGTLDDIQVGEPAMVVGLLTPRHLVLARSVSQCAPSTDGSEN